MSPLSCALPRDTDPVVRPEDAWVLRALHGIRYGSVEIVIHDGAVVQVERREKFRPPSARPAEVPS